jgi:hypothetical protein
MPGRQDAKMQRQGMINIEKDSNGEVAKVTLRLCALA